MKGKQPLTLAEMAAKSAIIAGKLACPRCNCADFRTYGKGPGHIQTHRYKECRHCGCKILTAQEPERMVRIVKDTSESDDVDIGVDENVV